MRSVHLLDGAVLGLANIPPPLPECACVHTRVQGQLRGKTTTDIYGRQRHLGGERGGTVCCPHQEARPAEEEASHLSAEMKHVR